MRKIEQQMVEALQNGKDWQQGNTAVTSTGTVYLHGNRIAYRNRNGAMEMDFYNVSKWDTKTTRSRCNAIGFGVYHHRGHQMISRPTVQI